MKKITIMATIFMILFFAFLNIVPAKVYAANTTNTTNTTNTVNETGNSRLLEMKENQAKTIKEYQEKYNSEPYGLTAYILHMVQIYSIPVCFLGIVVSLIYKVVIGRRHLENAEKGLGMTVAFVTITIICQILPLVFALVVKLGNK